MAHEADEAFNKGKTDPDVLALLDTSISSNKDFLFYHQQKDARAKLLEQASQKKSANKPSETELFKMMKTNPQMMELMMNLMKKGGMPNKRMPFMGDNPRGPKSGMPGKPGPGVPPTPDGYAQMMQNRPQGQMIPGFAPNMMFNNRNMPQIPMGYPPMGQNLGANQLMSMNQNMMPNMMPNFPGQAPPPKVVHDINWLKKSWKELDSMPQDQVKKILGSILYPMVASQIKKKDFGSETSANDLPPKVTGMLIDLDVLSIEEIVEMTLNENDLNERIEEALELIKNEDNGAEN